MSPARNGFPRADLGRPKPEPETQLHRRLAKSRYTAPASGSFSMYITDKPGHPDKHDRKGRSYMTQ
jgi:hypothetical protein